MSKKFLCTVLEIQKYLTLVSGIIYCLYHKTLNTTEQIVNQITIILISRQSSEF